MRRLNLPALIFCSFLLVFSSCSQDESVGPVEGEDMATLSFGAVLTDLMNENQGLKQALDDIPACSSAAPAYVAVVLSGTTEVGTMETPLLVPLNATPGDFDNDGDDEYFTVESPDLELTPGPYSLDFFAVYDSGDNLIWLAPTRGGDFAGYVNALPMDFNLGGGTKKYLDVNVLCFDNRFINLYGYLFFELEATEVVEFCLFGNVCDDNGRHAPANFRFDVWTYSGNPSDPHGEALFNESNPFINSVGINDDGDAFADPLCIFLPDSGGEDIYYGELYLIDNGTSTLIRSGQFTDEDVLGLHDGENYLDYYHFREGDCSMEDQPMLFEDEAPGSTKCEVINFEDLASPIDFTSDYYLDKGVEILAGPDYPGNAMKIMAGTCSENVLHSVDYPFASVLLNFSNEVFSVSLVAGDYGEDEDTIIVTAYSDLNGKGEVLASQTRVLAADEGGCLEFSLEADGIRSVIVHGQSSLEGNENTLFTDNLQFCKRL